MQRSRAGNSNYEGCTKYFPARLWLGVPYLLDISCSPFVNHIAFW
jgi:hypothetical protein